MNEEKDSLSLEKAFQDSKTVSVTELDDLKATSKLWEIVCVKEESNRPYILLGNEEDPESRVWVEFNGESKETLEKFFEWMEAGRKLHKDKARSVKDLDYLRKLMISFGCISSLVEDEEYSNGMFQLIICMLAKKWFLNDHPEHDNSTEAVMSNPDYNAYVELVARYVKQLGTFISSIATSTSEFIANPPTDENPVNL